MLVYQKNMFDGHYCIKSLSHLKTLEKTLRKVMFCITIVVCKSMKHSYRALTRILKTGVQDSHLAKSRSPTGRSGSPTQKKLESHQSVHTVYLFHFSRK